MNHSKFLKQLMQKAAYMMRYQYNLHNEQLTEEQKIKRVNFAHALLVKILKSNCLTKIIFCEESMFIVGDDKQWVWRRYGDENLDSK